MKVVCTVDKAMKYEHVNCYSTPLRTFEDNFFKVT